MDMLETIAPRSDQINAEDLLTGPQTITITDVKRSGSDEQPVDMVTAEFGPGRVYKPSKTMRRVIVAAWGKDSAAYVGRRLTIYRDPDVRFGAEKVGGIKISHMSHIDKRLQLALTVTRGKRAQFTVDPLKDEPAPTTAPGPAPSVNDVTKDQLQKLAILRQSEKYEDDEQGRADWFAFVSNTIGRTINASNKELTKAEASKVIELLESARPQ